MASSGPKRSNQSVAEAAGSEHGATNQPESSTWSRLPHPLEILTVAAFLSLTFLFGFFPLKDTDFWWHLRTGDLIRSTGQVPHKDLYTYTVPDAGWIDLHWGFQVLISLGYQLGGVPLLNLGKAVITTAAVALLLLGCRRRRWPIWVCVIAWLPGLLVLSGRMYVRPETLSLWWMAVVLWVVFHWRERPRLVWLLPVAFLFWVNTQGLFALGFVILAMAILDAAMSPAMWRKDRRDWWGRVIAACSLSVIACLANPYGLRGMLFPLSLAGTMNNPVFRSIGELTPIPQFIRSLGIREFPAEISLATFPGAIGVCLKHFPTFPLPLKLHLLAMALGVVSFLFPLVGWGVCRLMGRPVTEAETKSNSAGAGARKSAKLEAVERTLPVAKTVSPGPGPFSLFRALMWLFFSLLSLQATRNSHQFAAAMGFVTAANLGEAAAFFAAARRPAGDRSRSRTAAVSPGNAVALALVSLMLVWVGTGRFYRDAGEGRTIGLGEEPLWFPHDAVKAAGAPELPGKFASFHNGHASLYDYYHGPERKVFSDARLEVIGAELYQRQSRLSHALGRNESGWRSLVNAAERPVMLADHAANSGVSATLFTANDYVCIHFDPVAAVFAPAESVTGTSILPFDILKSHYSADGFRKYDAASRLALTRALRNIGGSLAAYGRDDLVRPMNLAGVGLATNLIEERPTEADHWKLLGQLLQASGAVALPRDAAPIGIDPVRDLATLRTIHALKMAVDLAPADFSSRYSLMMQQRALNQLDEERDSLRVLVGMTPINTTQASEIENSRSRLLELDRKLDRNDQTGGSGTNGDAQRSSGAGRAEIEQETDRMLAQGQFRKATEFMRDALPRTGAPEELAERLGASFLWMGDVESAQMAWAGLSDPARRAVLESVAAIVRCAGSDAIRAAIDRAVESTSTLSQGDPWKFAASILRANFTAETGDAAGARAALDQARVHARTSGQNDEIRRLERLIPVSSDEGDRRAR